MMKKTILGLAFLFLFASACKKYEYGPYFSFSSKKQRVEGNWKIDSAITSLGTDIGGELASYRFRLEKGGDARFEFMPLPGGVVDTLFGAWSLEEESDLFEWKNMIGDTTLFYYNGTESFDILRLTDEDFWLADKDNTWLYLSPE